MARICIALELSHWYWLATRSMNRPCLPPKQETWSPFGNPCLQLEPNCQFSWPPLSDLQCRLVAESSPAFCTSLLSALMGLLGPASGCSFTSLSVATPESPLSGCLWGACPAGSTINGVRPPGHQGASSDSHLCPICCKHHRLLHTLCRIRLPGGYIADMQFAQWTHQRRFQLWQIRCADLLRETHQQILFGLLAVIIGDGMQARSRVVAEDGAPVEPLVPFPEDLNSPERILHAVWPHIHGSPTLSSSAFAPDVSTQGSMSLKWDVPIDEQSTVRFRMRLLKAVPCGLSVHVEEWSAWSLNEPLQKQKSGLGNEARTPVGASCLCQPRMLKIVVVCQFLSRQDIALGKNPNPALHKQKRSSTLCH